MLPYYIMLLIIFVCIFLEDGQISENGKKKVFLLALLPVFILIALKSSEIGNDTKDYYDSYTALVQSHDFDSIDVPFGYERIELGYKYFILLLSYVFKDPQILSVITAIITCFALFKFIRKNASNSSLALFFFVTLGFFQFAMTGIRQTIAISILLLGFKFIQEKKLFKFVLTVLAAMSFHKSAIVFFPLYYVANIRPSKNKTVLLYTVLLILYFYADKLLISAAELLNYNYGIEDTANGYIFFAVVFLITILVTRHKDEIVENNPDSSVLININYISLATWAMRLVSRTMERVSLYFMPFTYIALAEYLTTRNKKERSLYIIIAVVLSSYLCIRRLSNDLDFRNYTFFFQ